MDTVPATSRTPSTDVDGLYRRLVERIPAIVYIETGPHPSPSQYMSPRIQDVLGWPAERFNEPGPFWMSIVHPDDLAAAIDSDARSDETLEPYRAEYRLKDSSGGWHWFRDEATFVPGDGRTEGHWLGVMVELTERKEAEHKLEDVQARYRNLVEQLPAATYVDAVDENLTSIYVSPQMESLIGIPADIFQSEDLWEASVYPDDREAAVRGTREAVAMGTPFLLEYRMVRPDGSLVWVRDQGSVVRDASGEPVYVQGLYMNITEQKAAEEELRAAVLKFQTLVERMPAVTYIDPMAPEPTPAIYLSPQLEELLGVPADEALELKEWWSVMLHPADRDRVLQAFSRTRTTGQPYRDEYRMVRTDGRVIWIHDESVLVPGPDGQPMFWLGSMYDITQQKRAEEDLVQALEIERRSTDRLREADEIKTAFLTAVSHDLRTPLSAILGNAITLFNEEEIGLTQDERRELTSSLVEKARHLSALVTDLLDMDRLGRRVVEPRRVWMDVGELTARLVETSDLLDGRDVRVRTEPAQAWIDPGMFARILENLLANIVRHTPPGSPVWIGTERAGAEVILSVEDAGPGVPEELRETLFRPFERGPSSSEHAPGVGIGLSLVAKFAELHGGRAWVQGREGGGASFRVSIPAAPATPLPVP
jgi:PAS domain S-box-containing protein